MNWIAATLVHNTPDLAARMLEQLPDVLIFDNGSTPEIPGAFKRFEANLGFVGGWNKAMRILEDTVGDNDYVWMLNSDVEGVCPQIGNMLAAHAWRDGLAATTPPFNSPHPVMGRPGAVNWVDWCMPMVDVNTWHAIGGFDERSTGYFADIDWCKRARDIGCAFDVAPVSSVWHRGGATAQAIGHTWDANDAWLCEKWGVKSWGELT